MKRCCRCTQDLPLSAFSKRSEAKDGLCGHCRNCARRGRRAWYVKYQARILAALRKPDAFRALRDRDGLKRCSTCHAYLPPEAFCRKARTSDGLNTNCRACEAMSYQGWFERHRDAETIRWKTYKATHKPQRNAHERQRYQVDARYRQQKIANAKVQQAKKSDHGIGRLRGWIATQAPEVLRDIQRNATHRRRSRLYGVPYGSIDLTAIALRDGWKCHICGKKVDIRTWSPDHLIPVSQGGPTLPINLALSHLRCNIKRGAGRLPAQLRLID
jgi:hypothetical protein